MDRSPSRGTSEGFVISGTVLNRPGLPKGRTVSRIRQLPTVTFGLTPQLALPWFAIRNRNASPRRDGWWKRFS
jgi:hypothetical protein